jgi:hypothetical protein
MEKKRKPEQLERTGCFIKKGKITKKKKRKKPTVIDK